MKERPLILVLNDSASDRVRMENSKVNCRSNSYPFAACDMAIIMLDSFMFDVFKETPSQNTAIKLAQRGCEENAERRMATNRRDLACCAPLMPAQLMGLGHRLACWSSTENSKEAWAAHATRSSRYVDQPMISCSRDVHEFNAGIGAGANHFSLFANTST